MSSKNFKAIRLDHGAPHPVEDPLPVEAVLHIKVNGVAYTTTVRTPGADIPLARGLLFSEGVLTHPVADSDCRTITDPDTGLTGCLEITVPDHFLAKELAGRRSAMANASCGLCGIREPEELALAGEPLLPPPGQRIRPDAISRVIAALPDHQPLFRTTGGVHGALAFGPDGQILSSHEDIGRHNAVDKVIGDLLGQGRLAEACGVAVSGRLSYEIVFKAFRAGWPYLFAVSAPSSMAVEMGEAFGLCIIAFCREGRATVYSRVELVDFDS